MYLIVSLYSIIGSKIHVECTAFFDTHIPHVECSKSNLWKQLNYVGESISQSSYPLDANSKCVEDDDYSVSTFRTVATNQERLSYTLNIQVGEIVKCTTGNNIF